MLPLLLGIPLFKFPLLHFLFFEKFNTCKRYPLHLFLPIFGILFKKISQLIFPSPYSASFVAPSFPFSSKKSYKHFHVMDGTLFETIFPSPYYLRDNTSLFRVFKRWRGGFSLSIVLEFTRRRPPQTSRIIFVIIGRELLGQLRRDN